MSQSISLTVQLDEPCQENWNDMDATQQGRFCNNCQKQVIDFTGFTDQQLLHYFLANPFPVCGRLRQSQRGHTIVATAPKINRSLSPVAATLLTLTAISMEAKAHNAPHRVAIQLTQPANKSVSFTPADSLLISGTVKDEHGAPLENAEIVFGEMKLLSDKNGYFQFTLPTAINKPAVIKFYYRSRETEVRSYHPLMGSASYEVVMYKPQMAGYFYGGGIAPIFTMLHLPDPVSTLSFQTSNKLDKATKDFLSNFAVFMKNQPDLRLSLRSYYKTSPKKAANLVKLVKDYLVDSEGVDRERFQLPHPQPKKHLTSEVIIEFGEPQPEE
jgi:hypothetical protein